ncbi:DUF1643 domain-containing protein [Sporosarcina sp. BP05]|uniref:DUF1643 domain-containing protein n=1 Tax=Sporosarcina sp. BP05 TaxID=2758726 RepID=UPI001645802D
MVQRITVNIISTAILSDNGIYRYQLTGNWDKSKRKATVIMINPSKASVYLHGNTEKCINDYK